MGWDGTDGLYDDIGAIALCDNLALGACPFNSSSYGDEENFDKHFGQDVNDGDYGNPSSWIGGPSDPSPFIVLKFFGEVSISAIAFGRDNTGVAGDRNIGTYTVAVTTDVDPDPFSATFTDVGTITINGDTAGFTGSLRHQYPLSTASPGCAPISATALKITTSPNSLCIDELEVYGPFA